MPCGSASGTGSVSEGSHQPASGFREIPRSRIILRYLQKPCHDAAPLWPPRLYPDPPPPAAEAVHIMTSSHDRHRRPRRLRLRYHLALQRLRILSTLRRAGCCLVSTKPVVDNWFCLIRHPLIIAPIAPQRQALLTERLLTKSPPLNSISPPISRFDTRSA